MVLQKFNQLHLLNFPLFPGLVGRAPLARFLFTLSINKYKHDRSHRIVFFFVLLKA